MTRDVGLFCSLYRIAQAVTKRIDVETFNLRLAPPAADRKAPE